MRQIVLDTETTGLDPAQGHRIIEIGCVEVEGRRITRRHLHHYLQPDREVEAGAEQVHGITNAFLADKPRFRDIAEELLAFVAGAELVIHNAPFDVGFLNAELKRLEEESGRPYGPIEERCTILDTLVMARKMHPGQKNSLDALCRRYEVDNSSRELHGALLDSQILAEVYLRMTGGQVSLSLGVEERGAGEEGEFTIRRLPAGRPPLRVIRADAAEQAAHAARLAAIDKASGAALWRTVMGEEGSAVLEDVGDAAEQ